MSLETLNSWGHITKWPLQTCLRDSGCFGPRYEGAFLNLLVETLDAWWNTDNRNLVELQPCNNLTL